MIITMMIVMKNIIVMNKMIVMKIRLVINGYDRDLLYVTLHI